MRTCCSWRAAFVAVGLTIGWAAGSFGAEAITRRQLDEFLDLGWTATAVDSTSVDQRYEQLLVETNRDSRLLYGYALVKIKLRKYAEASKLVDEVLDADAKNQNVWRTKIWLSVILKNYGQALVALEKSANFLAPEPKPGSEDEDPALAQVRFLGRVFGFLEGPVSDQAPQDSAAALRRKIAAKWGEERKEAFRDGRDSLIDRYLSLTDEKEAGREKARQQAEEERDQRLQELDQQREQDQLRVSDLQTMREKLRAELNDQTKEIQKLDAPLVDQLGRIDSQAVVIRRELALITSDLARWEALLARERDPFIRGGYLREIARLETLGARYDADLLALNRRAATFQSQRADLQRRLNQLQATTGKQMEGVEREQAELARQAKRRDGEERRLRKATGGKDSSQSLAKAAQAASLTTYEPFPLDAERQKLVDQLP